MDDPDDFLECPEVGTMLMRREGYNWTAYYKRPDGSKLFLMSADIDFLEEACATDEYKEFAFFAFQRFIKKLTGIDFDIKAKPAPEDDRAGHA